MEEIYKVIEGFENYSVSNLGNVKNNKLRRIMKQGIGNNGYYRVGITNNNRCALIRVHRLVALAFIENVENKQNVDHIDNNITNNSVNNLRWVNQKENIQNSSISKSNTSGSKGVSLHKGSNKWSAYIHIDGIKIHLGLFVDKQDAINARIQKANEAFGIYTNKCEKNN